MFRLSRTVPAVVLCLGMALLGCRNAVSPDGFRGPETPAKLKIGEVGAPIYPGVSFKLVGETSRRADDAVLIPNCHLTIIDKQELAAQVDGEVVCVGYEIGPDEKVPEGSEVITHPLLLRDDEKKTPRRFVRLKDGNAVKAGQIVIVLNDAQAVADYNAAKVARDNAVKEIPLAKSQVEITAKLWDQSKKLYANNSGTLSEVLSNEYQNAKAQSEAYGKETARDKAKADMIKAEVRLGQHKIPATIDGQISQIFKSPGEAEKGNSEPVVRISNFDRLRVEGFFDLQYDSAVRLGAKVTVEPSELSPPNVVVDFHALGRAINALAVSAHPTPLILSGGEDRIVYVWNRQRAILASLIHPDTLRAISCTRSAPDNKHYALTGCKDGVARLWDLTDPANISTKPLRELDGRHDGGVNATAFSPDGKYCLTADDRNIYLWTVADGKRVYAFPQEHRSPVTALHFLPQGRCVSVGRDNVAYVWMMGEKGAALETEREFENGEKRELRPFDNRSGDVPNLGVSDDGEMMVLDQDKTGLRLVRLSDHLPIATVSESAGESIKFASFAEFSPKIGPEGRRVLATGTSVDGVVQLWRMPTETSRPSELARLICADGSSASACAFSPNAENGFIVVGTKRGEVDLWDLPTAADLSRVHTATITYIESGIETSGKAVKVWAQLDNKTDRPLRPGTTATMVVPPVK